MSENSVIFLAKVNSSQADNKSAVQAAVSPSPVFVPEENVAGERGEESPVGGQEGPIEVGRVYETEVGTEADVEDEDEDVDVVGGVDEVGVSGYDSEGFFAGQSMNSIWLVMLRSLEHEDDLVRLLCFSVQSLWRTSGSSQ